MRRGRAYRFMVTPAGQNSTTREFQRAVRSHAATVSHPERSSRRRARIRQRNDGEGVIVFDANPDDPTEGLDHGVLPVAANAGELTIASTNSRQAGDFHSARPSQPFASMLGSPPRLRTDYLSGNTFSPLQHLATYHAPYLPGIVNHYISNLTIPIPELDGNSVAPLFRAVWLPIVFHDPVVFQVVVLFAATHYTTFADPSQYNDLHLELLTLKQSALLALIQTVQTEQTTPRVPSTRGRDSRDTLIAAAAKMASYEAIFGSSEAFHLHMSTVARLLRQQGGQATLGMDGFLARLLTFIDTNSAFLLGTNLYLEEFGLSDRLPRNQALLPRWFDEVAPRADEPRRSTNVINLERFIGFMNISTENNEATEDSS